MRFDRLLEIVSNEPVFESGLLLSGDVDPRDVRRQLSRWTRAGKLLEIRRGLYALAPPYRKVAAHPFLVANRLFRGTYVSCQSALAYHGLIPESVPVVTSVGAGRPGSRDTPLGAFDFRYIKPSLRYGYRPMDLGQGQIALVAVGEKALLDLVYLSPAGDDPRFLRELRLQHLEGMDLSALDGLAARSGSPKLRRAAEAIRRLARDETQEHERL
jgi:hypothetical protein